MATSPSASSAPGRSGRASAALGQRIGEWLPPWWVELLLIGLAYVCYQVVQVLVAGSESSAIQRARWLWQVEQDLNLDVELGLNQLVAASSPLILITGLFYGLTHFIITPLVLVWLRKYRTSWYPPLRNTLILTSLGALITYWLLPLAPPRLSIPAFVDTLKEGNVLAAADPSGPASLANQYAAMPSLHVAWAMWVALAIVVATKDRLRYLAWAYPVIATLIVMGTANHFIVDAVAGALLVWAAWRICKPRVRYQRTRFTTERTAPTTKPVALGSYPESGS